jgi:hypothetical protein
MSNDLNNSVHVKDEIDLIEIIKTFLESKKLIILTLLTFTIASIIISLSLKPSFISSTKLEIGYIELDNGDRVWIESMSDLISDLKILKIKNNFNQEVTMKSFEDKVIELKVTSKSGDQNENLLTEMTSYIFERHANLEKLITNSEINSLSFDIETTKAEITHFKSKLSDQNQSQYLSIISSLQKEDQPIELLRLLSENSSSKDIVFSLNQKLQTLIQELEKLNSSVKSKSQIIENIETSPKKPRTLLIISLGIILGFISSILLVSINNFIKSYRESIA